MIYTIYHLSWKNKFYTKNIYKIIDFLTRQDDHELLTIKLLVW